MHKAGLSLTAQFMASNLYLRSFLTDNFILIESWQTRRIREDT